MTDQEPLTQATPSSSETGDSERTRRSETAYLVVLVNPVDNEEGDLETWMPLGTVTVTARTNRAAVIDMVLDGQLEGGSATAPAVPQIPMDAGERGELLVLPVEHIGARVPFGARQRVIFERVDSSS